MHLVSHVLDAIIASIHTPHPTVDLVLAIMSVFRATIGVASAIVRLTQLLKRGKTSIRTVDPAQSP